MRRPLLLRAAAPSEFHEVGARPPQARHLLTVRGVGYRFVSNPGAE
ncbi:MAG TPA: hypothetical protein VNV86_12175 [Candidatus Acidoferrum sp.]|nr:hypothetical protein [Candidatus Acidoferrum sp.]